MTTKSKKTFTGGVVELDSMALELGIAQIKVNLKSERQPDFVHGNITVEMKDGTVRRGMRILKSQFQNQDLYLEYPGYSFVDRDKKKTRISYFTLSTPVQDYILNKALNVLELK